MKSSMSSTLQGVITPPLTQCWLMCPCNFQPCSESPVRNDVEHLTEMLQMAATMVRSSENLAFEQKWAKRGKTKE